MILIRRDDKHKASEYFYYSEFFPHNNYDEHEIDERLISAITFIRKQMNCPIKITCTFRTEAENKALYNSGVSAVKTFGKGNSHFDGIALDFKFIEKGRENYNKFAEIIRAGEWNFNNEIYKGLRIYGINGFGIYNGFFHIDTRPKPAGGDRYFWDLTKKA